MKVSELFAEIGFKVDTKGLNDFSNSLKGIKQTIQQSVSGLSKMAAMAEKLSNAANKIKEGFSASDKDLAARYRAETSHIRAQASLLRGNAKKSRGLGAYWGQRADFVERDALRLEATQRLREEQFEWKKEHSTPAGGVAFGLKKVLGSLAAPLLTGFLILKSAAKVFESASKLFSESVNRAFNYRNFGYITGLDVNRLSRLQNIIQRGGTDLTAEQVSSDVANLQQYIKRVQYTGEGYWPFGMLNVSVFNRDTFEVLDDLKKAVRNLDNATKQYFLGQLGLGHPDWIRYFNDDLQERFLDQYTKLTAGERQDTTALGVSGKRLGTALKDLWDKLVQLVSGPLATLLDILSLVVDAFNVLLKTLRPIEWAVGFLIGTFKGLGYWIGEFCAWLASFLPHTTPPDTILDKGQHPAADYLRMDFGGKAVYPRLSVMNTSPSNQTNNITVASVGDAAAFARDSFRNPQETSWNWNTFNQAYGMMA